MYKLNFILKIVSILLVVVFPQSRLLFAKNLYVNCGGDFKSFLRNIGDEVFSTNNNLDEISLKAFVSILLFFDETTAVLEIIEFLTFCELGICPRYFKLTSKNL